MNKQTANEYIISMIKIKMSNFKMMKKKTEIKIRPFNFHELKKYLNMNKLLKKLYIDYLN